MAITQRRIRDPPRVIVAEQEAVFGRLPEFDFGSYTFIADYQPYAFSDGMELEIRPIFEMQGPAGDPPEQA